MAALSLDQSLHESAPVKTSPPIKNEKKATIGFADSPHPMRGSAIPAESHALFYLQAFILIQIACQLGLLVGPAGMVRVALRSAGFVGSLMLLLLLPARGPKHPAFGWAIASLVMLGLGFLQPTTHIVAGLAQFAMCLAIVGPLFWVPRLAASQAVLRRILAILWGFHSLSAAVGVLQVYFPGRFQPKLSQVIEQQGVYADGLKIVLANGEEVWRPMGLTDVPGGAAMAGLYAIVLGSGFFLTSRSGIVRLAAVGSTLLGLFCIYLSQVRSILVVTGVCILALLSLLAQRGDLRRLLGLALAGACVVVIGTLWAFSVGGESVNRRLTTLVEDRPTEVYYRNRGVFLEDTLLHRLPEFPLGAGLGRWGMMYQYFGDRDDLQSPVLHAEIQWTAWVYDGGVPLLLCYAAALLTTCWVTWRIGSRPGKDPLTLWTVVILAYDLGALAITFNYPLFNGQGGMEFWLLNATLFTAATYRQPGAGRMPA